MKKLFVALMAVLVLASCGEKKEEVKTPGDVMLMTANIIETAAANVENAANVDDIINAMAALKTETDEIHEKYGEIVNEMDSLDEVQYAKETEALTAAFKKYHEVMFGKMDLLENMTPEQEKRLEQMLGIE